MEIRGFTYGYDGREGDYRSVGGILSQQRLFETGVNWICLCFTVEQEDIFSRRIAFRYGETVSDRDIIAVVKNAHEHGVKVCLKPTLNSRDGIWRARITFPDVDQWGRDLYWDEWFEAYGAFMTYYARLAEELGCEMFCVGCELCGTEQKEWHWRKLIEEIRIFYHGKLTYNTNHGHELEVKWFKALDYIGTSAYFPVGSEGHVSFEDMAEKWSDVLRQMREVYEHFDRPVIFMEIGCRSAAGCSEMPWDFEHKDLPHDEEEQANFYDSCLDVFSNRDWFAGCFWWDWSSLIYTSREEAEKDNGFNIHLKRAEQVLKKWYEKLA
ncbi:MAG: glycosyl hydrolase family 53 [Lachnospiraceae bacterium]|nr:glycosyl hydrolase family 53 [Lachnospiraceae bacterium]